MLQPTTRGHRGKKNLPLSVLRMRSHVIHFFLPSLGKHCTYIQRCCSCFLMTNSVCPFSINTSVPLHRRLRPWLTPILDNLISLSLSLPLSLSRVAERRGITLRGEHPLRWRAAVGVLPDRRGGKINRCRLSCRFLYPQSALQFK